MSAVRERWGIALPAGALLALAGCAQITIQAGDGSVTQATRFGIVSVEPRPGATAQVIDLRGIGLIAQNGGVTLGYLSSSTAVLPADDCRIVIWGDDGLEAPAALARLLDGRSPVCTAGP